jgi:tetratricopeptide (TPR) repeat protein
MDMAWGYRNVELNPENVDKSISNLRQALGDETKTLIKSIQRIGYRFDAEVIDQSATEGPPVVPLADGIQKNHKWQRVLVGLFLLCCLLGGLGWLVTVTRRTSNKAVTQKSSAERLFEQAAEYERTGDDEQALLALDQAIAADPEMAEAYYRAALISYDFDKREQATKYLDGAIALIPRRDAHFKLKVEALKFEIEDNAQRALAAYELLADAYPNDADGLYGLAANALQAGNKSTASQALGRCLAQEPKNPYCNYQQMMLLLGQNKFDEVLGLYQTVIKDGVRYVWLEEPVGLAYMGLNDASAARVHFEALQLTSARYRGTLHANATQDWIIEVLLFEGKFAEAKRRSSQMEEVAPQETRTQYIHYLAKISLFEGDIDAARRYGREAVRQAKDPAILTSLAFILASAADSKGVHSALARRAGLGLTFDKPATQHYIRGMDALSKGQTALALAEFDLSRQMDPYDYETAYFIALAYMRLHRHDKAIPLLEEITKEKGTVLRDESSALWPLAIYNLAVCYDNVRKPSLADSTYAEFLSLWGATANASPQVLAANARTLAANK